MSKYLRFASRFLPNSILEEPYSLLSSPSSSFSKFKDVHAGKRCFIIGNGPSLNKVDFSLLESEFTFAVNGIFYKTDEVGFRPTYYVVEDTHVMLDNLRRIVSYKPAPGGAKFLPAKFRLQCGGSPDTLYLNFNRGFYEPMSSYFEVPRFSTDISRKVYCGQSVTIANLQLAYFMGFSEVYLLGMDFSYSIPVSAKVDGAVIESTEDDVNHFHPDYFGKGKKWHDPKLHNVLKSYQLCKLMYEQTSRRIYNATYGGNLELFERVDFIGLFSR